MIPFLRKIRRILLAKNKFGRYLIYAFGEIVLVIIGILIALQVNNSNEIRKKEKEAKEILKQVQQELAANVKATSGIIEFSRIKDSLIYLVQMDKVNAQDYKNNPGFFNIALSYQTFPIRDFAFNRLVQNIDYMPEETDSLMIDLIDFYTGYKKMINEHGEAILEVTGDFITFLKENKNWFGANPNLPGYEKSFEDKLDYYLNDPNYKNWLSVYKTVLVRNLYQGTLNFRTDAIYFYKEISHALTPDIEPGTEDFPFYYNAEEFRNWVGSYEPENPEDILFEITIENGILFMIINKNFKHEIYPLTNSKFYTDGNYGFVSLTMDENKSVKNLHYHFSLNNYCLTWNKVE